MIEAAQIRLIELIPIGRQPISSTMSRLLQPRKRTRSRSLPSRSLGVSNHTALGHRRNEISIAQAIGDVPVHAQNNRRATSDSDAFCGIKYFGRARSTFV